jgi:hypothetical protein
MVKLGGLANTETTIKANEIETTGDIKAKTITLNDGILPDDATEISGHYIEIHDADDATNITAFAIHTTGDINCRNIHVESDTTLDGIPQNGDLFCDSIEARDITLQENNAGTVISALGLYTDGTITIESTPNVTSLTVEHGDIKINDGGLQVSKNIDIVQGNLTFGQGLTRNRQPDNEALGLIEKEWFDIDDNSIKNGLSMNITHHIKETGQEVLNTTIARFTRLDLDDLAEEEQVKITFEGDAYVKNDKLLTSVSVNSATLTGNGTVESPLNVIGGGGGGTVITDESLNGVGTEESKLRVAQDQELHKVVADLLCARCPEEETPPFQLSTYDVDVGPEMTWHALQLAQNANHIIDIVTDHTNKPQEIAISTTLGTQGLQVSDPIGNVYATFQSEEDPDEDRKSVV